jgi:hypothetical protein
MKKQNTHCSEMIPVLLTALAFGCFWLAPVAQAAPRPTIVGLWNVHYYQDETELFQTYDQWHSDGLEFEVNSVYPGAVCQGTFKQRANGTVQLFHVVFTYDADGVFNGHIEETQTNTVSADNTTYQGTFDQKFYDLGGNFLFEATGTLTATRLTVAQP